MKRGKNNDNVIGFDPLAWMKETSPESGIVSREATTKANPEPADPTQHPGLGTQDPPGTVRLGDILTIEQAAAMHAELGRHLGARSVALEAGALRRLDTAGLQLLAAFVRAAGERGAAVEWRDPPPELREAARRLGLETALRLA